MKTKMPDRKRSYDQWCAVARSLDLVGARWTLLIVRDLLIGPKRYKDILAGLPGIGTNLLAQRLRELEAHGLVERRTLPAPASATVYRLTEKGVRLVEGAARHNDRAPITGGGRQTARRAGGGSDAY